MNERISTLHAQVLRAAYTTSLHMLVKVNRSYATRHFGGQKFPRQTIEAMVAHGLLARIEGTTSVRLTARGTDYAAQLHAAYDNAAHVAAQSLAERRAKARTARMLREQMILRHTMAAADQRRQWRRTPAPADAADLSPAFGRMPYAD